MGRHPALVGAPSGGAGVEAGHQPPVAKAAGEGAPAGGIDPITARLHYRLAQVADGAGDALRAVLGIDEARHHGSVGADTTLFRPSRPLPALNQMERMTLHYKRRLA
jgi:hypothetical protein